MKSVEMIDATRPLSDYAKAAKQGPVIVTRRGRPVAAVVALDDRDWEDLKVSTSTEFAAIIARSEERYRAEGGIPLSSLRARPASRRSRRKPRRR